MRTVPNFAVPVIKRLERPNLYEFVMMPVDSNDILDVDYGLAGKWDEGMLYLCSMKHNRIEVTGDGMTAKNSKSLCVRARLYTYA